MGVIHRFCGTEGNFDWEGAAQQAYGEGCRRILIGPAEGARNFALRYFEIAPGGQSSFDMHEHDHGVFILRGRARLLLGSALYEVGYGDVIYIEPHEPHQFEVLDDEPLGFLCVNPPKES